MTPDEESDVLEFPRCRLWRSPDGTFRIVIREQAAFDSGDAEALLSAIEAARTERALVVADIRGIVSVTLGVRKLMSSSRAGKAIRAAAFIVGTPLNRMIGDFFLRLNRPPFELRMFQDETLAIAWLAERRG